MKVYLCLLFVVYINSLAAQQSIIQINDTLTAHRYEFSALAKWHNKILLVPQDRRNVIDSIYFIDSSEIEQSLQKNTIAAHTAFAIKNLKHVGPRKDSLYINNVLLKKYDGFEASVVKDDTIFFSLEADTSFCYLVKGIIDGHTRSVNILPDTMHIPNTYPIDNAGYESLALLPGKDSLIAFFECNKDVETARAFMFGTNLKGTAKPVEWQRPLYFRITDAYAVNDSQLVGINRLFTNQAYPYERDAYIQCENLSTVEKQITNGGAIDTCFNQLVKLTITNNKINWQPYAFISLADVDNYEGLVPFDKGVLIVVDGEPGNNPCKLVYMPLK